jgi:hypothetical protein
MFISDRYLGEMLPKNHLKLIFALAVIIAILSLVSIVILTVLWYTKLAPFQDYAVVVDAGSTHSKIFVYT